MFFIWFDPFSECGKCNLCIFPLNILKKRMFAHQPLVFMHEGPQGAGKVMGRRATASLSDFPGGSGTSPACRLSRSTWPAPRT